MFSPRNVYSNLFVRRCTKDFLKRTTVIRPTYRSLELPVHAFPDEFENAGKNFEDKTVRKTAEAEKSSWTKFDSSYQ